MYNILKHTHFTFILLAVVLFILNFYWLKSGHKNSQKPIFKKMLLHTHLAILVLGLCLMGYLHINPLAESSYWLLEKIVAFAAYLLLVSVALNDKKRAGMQYLAFIGAFGWLFCIAGLAFGKQAIILVG
ncbi:SirB2 family protein [Psychromonas sp. MME2]|uniref:SirB2 family protein n=1 Tax=unclassified Psychromonas TaxID=2614957 RepID=UPI00339CD19E